MAARFWVGGTGTWDTSTTTNWASSSGGAGGASAPTSADTVTFNSASGTGTVTISGAVCSTFAMTAVAAGGIVFAFGSSSITCSGSGTIWSAVGTNITYTGTPTVNISNNSATATTITNVTGWTATNTFNFNITVGTYALTITTSAVLRSLNFTGFTGTWSPSTNTVTFYGSLTLVSGMTFTTGTGVFTFAATSGTQTITSASKTLNPITQNGVGGTVALGDALTLGTTANYVLTNGTLNLANNTLSTGIFASTNANTRSIAFGTGQIALIGNNLTILSMANATGFTYTGTPTVNCTYSGSTGTRTTAFGSTSGATASNVININITAGSDTLSTTNGSAYRNLNFTGFTGTLSSVTRTIYGDLTFNTGITGFVTTSATTFAATSGTQVLTTNGQTIGFPIIQNGVGGTLQLGSALTMSTVSSTSTITLTNGTFNANNFSVTTVAFSSNNSNTRTITMGSSTWTLTAAGTVWNLGTTTGLTFNKNTANIVLSNTTATARTFAGGGLTYNNLTIGGATGTSTLTFTGANTFGTLASTKTVAHTITFPASTTTTFTTFGIVGTSGNLVTINSSTAGTQATLSQASGTVNSNYLSIQDSNATGGAVWNAGSNSVNVSNNTGWVFGGGNYFLLF
jgi:hypothetical protein